jgi:Flp pilus assembly protein TadG
MKRREQGLTTVEFSLIATVTVVVLFGVIEMARLFYTFGVLAEGMRRAARVAAVCPIGSPAIRRAVRALDGGPGGLPGFSDFANIQVQYLDQFGNPTAAYGFINYVQVQVVNYDIPLAIPFIWPTVTSPAFAVTLPRESLGVTPTTAEVCGGFGFP